MSSPRWACPQCHGTRVQVSYPTWYHESADFELQFVETDAETVLWWYCEDCDDSGDDEPERVAP